MTAWRMSFRAGTNGPEMWDKYCCPLKVAAIEYGPVDDIDFSPYASEGQFPPHVKEAWAKLKPNEKTNLRRFLFEMKAGEDIVYVKKGPMIVGKGIVGPYRFDKKGRIKDPKLARTGVTNAQCVGFAIFQCYTYNSATSKSGPSNN